MKKHIVFMCENYIVGISLILREKVFESFHLTIHLQPCATLQGKQIVKNNAFMTANLSK